MALHKSYVYVLNTILRDGKRCLDENQKYLPAIPITQQDNQHEIHLFSPKQARKMLGVITAPNGNSKEQATVLRLKAEQWSKSLQEKSLYQHEALL